MKRVKILFVCLGNICRSPLAEAVFKHKITGRELEKYVVADSCGTSNYHIGDIPDSRTIANALKNGVSIDHFGRQLCTNDLDQFDYILAMDHSNYQNIVKITQGDHHHQKVMLMRDFDPQGKGLEVPDPYYGGERGFQEVFDILNRSMDQFIAHLEEKYLPQVKV